MDGLEEATAVVLEKLSGPRVSEPIARRTREAAGREVGRRVGDGRAFGGEARADVSLDLTGPGMQGKGGVRAEGRMAAVAMAYDPVPEGHSRWADPSAKRTPGLRARHLAGLGGPEAPGEPARRQAARVGMDDAERWVALSDAGSGVGDRPRVNLGRVGAVILDSYHVAEHRGDPARAPYPGDESAREGWLGPPCHRLEHEGGEAVLAELRSPPPAGRDSARKAHGRGDGVFREP